MFSWNETKRKTVIKAHGIDFAYLEDVFEDAFSIEFIDDAHLTADEIRYGVIGKTAVYGLIELIYTNLADDTIRFITARRAEHWMVREYEKRSKRKNRK